MLRAFLLFLREAIIRNVIAQRVVTCAVRRYIIRPQTFPLPTQQAHIRSRSKLLFDGNTRQGKKRRNCGFIYRKVQWPTFVRRDLISRRPPRLRRRTDKVR